MDSETLTRLLIQKSVLLEEEARDDILETGVKGAQFVRWTMEDISAFCKGKAEKVTAFLTVVNGQAPKQKETTAPSAGSVDLPLGGSNGSSSMPTVEVAGQQSEQKNAAADSSGAEASSQPLGLFPAFFSFACHVMSCHLTSSYSRIRT